MLCVYNTGISGTTDLLGFLFTTVFRVNKERYKMSLSIREVRGNWPDLFEQTGSLRKLKQQLFTDVLSRNAYHKCIQPHIILDYKTFYLLTIKVGCIFV